MDSRVRLAVVRAWFLVGAIACLPADNLIAQTALPSPWLAADVGAPAPSGTSSFDGQTMSVTVGGARIGGTSDQFRFVYQQIAGNVEVTARVDSVFYASALSSAGVMIRSSLAANSIDGAVLASAG